MSNVNNNNKNKEKLLKAVDTVEEFVAEEVCRLNEGRPVSFKNQRRLRKARKLLNEYIHNDGYIHEKDKIMRK